jgi:hypothetical protein
MPNDCYLYSFTWFTGAIAKLVTDRMDPEKTTDNYISDEKINLIACIIMKINSAPIRKYTCSDLQIQMSQLNTKLRKKSASEYDRNIISVTILALSPKFKCKYWS